MNTYPRLESRVSALERQQAVLGARMEELSEDVIASFKQIDTRFNQLDACVGELSRDMTASFKQLVEYHIQQENQIDTRFNQVDGRLDKIGTRLNQVDGRLDKMDTDITEIKTTMATKADLKTEIAAVRSDIKNDMMAMETRILDVFKQLLAPPASE